jgi:hypothetical protein
MVYMVYMVYELCMVYMLYIYINWNDNTNRNNLVVPVFAVTCNVLFVFGACSLCVFPYDKRK